VVSLLLHGLLLSLTFGGEGFGLPGLALPWQDRRAEVPELRVVLVPPTPAAVPAPLPVPLPDDAPPTEAPGAAAPAPAADEPPPPPSLNAPTAVAPTALIAVQKATDPRWTVPAALPASAPVVAAFEAASSPLADRSELTRLRLTRDAALTKDTPSRSDELAQLDRARGEAQQMTQQVVQQQLDRLAEAERQDAARREAERAAGERREAERLAAARAEAARLEAERAEAARRLAEQQAAARREAAQQEAARQEAARQEALRQEAARQQTAQAEAARQAAARQEAARQEAARQESARQEAARQEAARQDAARQEAARQEAARQEAARDAAARAQAAQLAEAKAAEAQREARLRAIGQQLNEEAAKRDAARQATSNLPSSWSSARRGRLFGRTDANAEMVLYAEAWARKIQLNPTMDAIRELVRQPHTDPLVTVAIRADGTVESISFYRSSGVPAIDDAVRRIIESQANYPAFPPALAREYDVIEIRRTWHFDSAIRLY
jgi:TonB family protein